MNKKFWRAFECASFRLCEKQSCTRMNLSQQIPWTAFWPQGLQPHLLLFWDGIEAEETLTETEHTHNNWGQKSGNLPHLDYITAAVSWNIVQSWKRVMS